MISLREFLNNYSINLSSSQAAAAERTEGPVLLLAVPGSGKTTVLVARLGYMIIGCGIDPENILTVTYTVAAARDMKKRYAAVFGEKAAHPVEFRTINGMAQKILNLYGQKTGRTAFKLISDEKERSLFLRDVYREIRHDFPTESDIKELSAAVTYTKNMLLTVRMGEELKTHGNTEFPKDFASMYLKYQEILRREKRMDYDDQLTAAYRILCTCPVILSELQSRYRYICVDEAQDTSKVQHKIIELIARGTGNIFMVGDEDQSIYGFRAAYPEALLDFEKTYPGAEVFLMEDNYRSDGNIVAAADLFIKRNVRRREKNMSAYRESRNGIKEIRLSSRKRQYAYLLGEAEKSGSGTAVLFRDNECAIPIIDIFERNNIPYRMRQGDAAFFTHRVVQDIENIIRFAYDPHDTEIFQQIYYKLNLYLSKQLAEAAVKRAEKSGSNVLDTVIGMKDAGIYVIKNAKALKAQLEKIRSEKARIAVNRIVDLMGYGEYMERTHLPESKIDILSAVAEGEESSMGLIRRLSELKDVMGGDTEQPGENGNGITLSTIHSSKGLEYDRVFLIDVVDGRFPEVYIKNMKTASDDELNAFEEERRLFYVGMTRARDELCILTYENAKSGFAEEIFGKKTVKPVRKKSTGDSFDISAASMKAFAAGERKNADGRK